MVSARSSWWRGVGVVSEVVDVVGELGQCVVDALVDLVVVADGHGGVSFRGGWGLGGGCDGDGCFGAEEPLGVCL